MLYPYAYRYKLGDFVVLFHPINMATLYVKKELLNNEKKPVSYTHLTLPTIA